MSQDTLSLFVRVVRKRSEAEDIVSFELADPHGRPLPACSAGAHVDVRVRDGVIRQYSLCNHPEAPDRYLIAVLREPESRGGSLAMHDEIQEGDLLQISAPRNHFPLKPASRYLLLAGGIGITPILSMADHLASTQADFALHYATRSPARMAFRERLETATYADRVHCHFDDGDDAQRFDLDALLDAADTETHVYICGPAGFIDHVLSTCKSRGWSDDRLHREYFSGAVVDTSDDTGFDIKIASTGAVFSVPDDKTVHKVLEENGIEVMVSCEEGVCGTCLTRVLEGIPDHRDLYLDDDEHAANDQFTPCCSRAKSKMLVLDL